MTLSSSDIEHFIEHGFTFVRGALSKRFVRETWGPCRVFLDHLQGFSDETHLFFPRRLPPWSVKEKSPALDAAINQLIGGSSYAAADKMWGDGFVVAQPTKLPVASADNIPGSEYLWHVDGFHRHFLDSPEIGLVALVMWTDSSITNGATVLAGKSIEVVTRILKESPEGLSGDFFDKNRAISGDWEPKIRVEGESGDVCLMHPFLLHSIQRNLSKDFRAVSNPVVALAQPMQFNRRDRKHTPVEQAILRALQVDLLDFNATGARGSDTQTALSNKYTLMRAGLKRQMESFFSQAGP